MPNIANMNIGIGANLGSLKAGLNSAQKQITSFSEGVESRLGSISTTKLEKNLADVGDVGVQSAQDLAKSLDMVEGQLQQTARTSRGVAGVSSGLHRSFQQGTSAVRANSAAVVNFNRVIQDAPFGIIGVANNLEPLISSFQSLKTQTGSTTGALKTLLTSAFTGPGALITSVSVASSLLLVFGDDLFGAGEKAEDAEGKVSALTDSLSKLRDVTSEDTSIAEGLERDIDDLEKFIGITSDLDTAQARLSSLNMQLDAMFDERGQAIVPQENIDNQKELIREQRNEVSGLKTLQKEYEGYLGSLEVAGKSQQELKSQLKDLKSAYDIASGGAQDADVALNAYVDTIQGKAQQAINNYESGIARNTDAIQSQAREVGGLLRSFQALARNGNEEARLAAIKLYETWGDLKDQLPDAELEKLNSDFADVNKQAGDSAQKLPRVTQELNAIGDAIKNIPPVTNLLPADIGDVGRDVDWGEMLPEPGSINAMNSELSRMQSKLKNLEVGSPAFRELRKEVWDTEKAIFKATTGMEGAWGDFVFTAKQAGADMMQFLAGEVSNAIASFASNLGQMFAGAGDEFATGLDKILLVVVDFAKSLATLLISIGTALELIPGFGQVAGAPYIIAGAALMTAASAGGALIQSGIDERRQQSQNLDGARANGGPVMGGGSYLVGENGPEIFTPNMSGTIIPNNRMGIMQKAREVTVRITGEFRQRGTDLVATIDQTQTGTLR